MTVYLDVILIENLCMNYIILFATGYIMKLKMKQLRIIISSLIGGIYAIISYINIIPIYSTLIAKIILSISMIYIAYFPKNIKLCFKELVLFYVVSFVFGGCAFALLYFVKPQDVLMKNGVYIGTYPIKIALLGGIVGFIITNIAFKIIKTKLKKKDMIYKIKIQIFDKEEEVSAMLDTGNLLRDPISKIPVIIVEKEKLYSIIPAELLDNIEKIIGGEEISFNNEYFSRLKILPFSSMGKQNGLMLGIKADKIIIEKEEVEERENIIIGISMQKLENNYSALFGLDLLEGSESDELITIIEK